MKRLLVTCNYPPIHGGQATYFQALWSGLDPSDAFLLLPSQCRSESLDRRGGVFYCPMSVGETWFERAVRFFSLLYCTWKTARKRNPDEIHFGQIMVGGLCGIIIRRVMGTPFIVHCHGADLLEFLRHGTGRAAARMILSECKCAIANSRFTEGKIREFMKDKEPRTIIVNPCVEEQFFYSNDAAVKQLKMRLGLDCTKVLLSVGRLVQRKGFDKIIEAIMELRDSLPDIQYVLVGDGPYRTALEKMVADRRLESRVKFCGAVGDEALPLYYKIASLFVMAPRFIEEKGDVEGFGIVYLEANAAGLPVIAGRSGGVQDAVKNGITGIIVDNPEYPSEIAAAIQRILTDDKLRARLAENALEWAKSHRRENMQKAWKSQLEKAEP